MKRLVFTAAVAAALLTGAGPALAAQPTPTPMPEVSDVPATPIPTLLPTASPTVTLDPNTSEVCDKSRTTITDGIKTFTDELTTAGTLAANGDLVGAEKSVKQSGTDLIELAGKLRQDATMAEKPELKSALDDVAKELDTLGADLTSLTSLQNFDTKRLETLAQRVSELCGTE